MNPGAAPRVVSIVSSATPAIDTDTCDIAALQLDGPVTSMTSGLTGTPANGQKLAVRISDDGDGPWPITWGPAFINSGVMPENFDISVLEVTEPHVSLAR